MGDFGMPLHAQDEPLGRVLDHLGEAVVAESGDPQGTGVGDALVVVELTTASAP